MKKLNVNVFLINSGAGGMKLTATFKDTIPYKVVQKTYKETSGKNIQRFVEVLIKNGLEKERQIGLAEKIHNFINNKQKKNQKITEHQAYRKWEDLLTRTLNKVIAQEEQERLERK